MILRRFVDIFGNPALPVGTHLVPGNGLSGMVSINDEVEGVIGDNICTIYCYKRNNRNGITSSDFRENNVDSVIKVSVELTSGDFTTRKDLENIEKLPNQTLKLYQHPEFLFNQEETSNTDTDSSDDKEQDLQTPKTQRRSKEANTEFPIYMEADEDKAHSNKIKEENEQNSYTNNRNSILSISINKNNENDHFLKVINSECQSYYIMLYKPKSSEISSQTAKNRKSEINENKNTIDKRKDEKRKNEENEGGKNTISLRTIKIDGDIKSGGEKGKGNSYIYKSLTNCKSKNKMFTMVNVNKEHGDDGRQIKNNWSDKTIEQERNEDDMFKNHTQNCLTKCQSAKTPLTTINKESSHLLTTMNDCCGLGWFDQSTINSNESLPLQILTKKFTKSQPNRLLDAYRNKVKETKVIARKPNPPMNHSKYNARALFHQPALSDKLRKERASLINGTNKTKKTFLPMNHLAKVVEERPQLSNKSDFPRNRKCNTSQNENESHLPANDLTEIFKERSHLQIPSDELLRNEESNLKKEKNESRHVCLSMQLITRDKKESLLQNTQSYTLKNGKCNLFEDQMKESDMWEKLTTDLRNGKLKYVLNEGKDSDHSNKSFILNTSKNDGILLDLSTKALSSNDTITLFCSLEPQKFSVVNIESYERCTPGKNVVHKEPHKTEDCSTCELLTPNSITTQTSCSSFIDDKFTQTSLGKFVQSQSQMSIYPVDSATNEETDKTDDFGTHFQLKQNSVTTQTSCDNFIDESTQTSIYSQSQKSIYTTNHMLSKDEISEIEMSDLVYCQCQLLNCNENTQHERRISVSSDKENRKEDATEYFVPDANITANAQTQVSENNNSLPAEEKDKKKSIESKVSTTNNEELYKESISLRKSNDTYCIPFNKTGDSISICPKSQDGQKCQGSLSDEEIKCKIINKLRRLVAERKERKKYIRKTTYEIHCPSYEIYTRSAVSFKVSQTHQSSSIKELASELEKDKKIKPRAINHTEKQLEDKKAKENKYTEYVVNVDPLNIIKHCYGKSKNLKDESLNIFRRREYYE